MRNGALNTWNGTQRGDIIMEIKVLIDFETNNRNDITDVFLINKGSGYISSITITSSGSNRKLLHTYRNR